MFWLIVGDLFLTKSSFTVIEAILATRISLIRSVREKEEREQIGNLVTPFVKALIDVEKSCLLSLSKSARESLNLQVALNSVVRAQTLEQQPSSLVSQEYANVLWLHNERKLAVQFLKDLVISKPKEIQKLSMESKLKNAVHLARLVIDLFAQKIAALTHYVGRMGFRSVFRETYRHFVQLLRARCGILGYGRFFHTAP